MDDHFWPSLYPGLIVGTLIGLGARSVAGTLAGAAGGLGGAYLAYRAALALALPGDILPLAAVILGAAAGAKLVMLGAARLAGPQTPH